MITRLKNKKFFFLWGKAQEFRKLSHFRYDFFEVPITTFKLRIMRCTNWRRPALICSERARRL